MFTEISLNDVSVPSGSSSTEEDTSDDAEQTGIPVLPKHEFSPEVLPPAGKRPGDEWRITQLPEGFRLAERNKYVMPANRMPVEHLVLTDGLASVSVFIEKFDPKDKFEGTSHRGAVNAYGTVSHGHQITLVGEVPVATVQLIGQSIQHQSEP
jgi:sigma-E factor negative regulatory protein RseB